MDPDVFTDFKFMPIILKLFFYEGMSLEQKDLILEVVETYFEKKEESNVLSKEVIEEFLGQIKEYEEFNRIDDHD